MAAPIVKSGFLPDSISTDLHIGSMNAGMKDMLNVASKFLALGMSVDDVVTRSTWNPAREIKREDLGHLSVGAIADVAVLRLNKGDFGFVDMYGAKMRGNQKLTCEMTIKDGKVLYDLNGLSRDEWMKLPADYGPQGTNEWDGTIGHGRAGRSAPAKVKALSGSVRVRRIFWYIDNPARSSTCPHNSFFWLCSSVAGLWSRNRYE